jgi:hypothetical protein
MHVYETVTSITISHAHEYDENDITDIHNTSICLYYSIFVCSHSMFTYIRFKVPSGKELHHRRKKKGVLL